MAEDIQAFTGRLYREHVTDVVCRLRELASEVERAGRPYDTATGDCPRYSAAVRNVLRTLDNGMNYVNVSVLVKYAAIADAAERVDFRPEVGEDSEHG